MTIYRIGIFLRNLLLYIALTFFAFVMLFPFLVMLFTSFKEAGDTYRFPPKLLPRAPITAEAAGFDEPLPVYHVDYEGTDSEFVLIEKTVKVGEYSAPNNLDETYIRELDLVTPTGDEENPQTVLYQGEEEILYDIEVAGEIIPMIQLSRTALGRFADPNDLSKTVLQNVRQSEPAEKLTYHPENYQEVVSLHGMDRSLTNTMLVTILVVLGQLVTSVLGGYAFARLDFPGRDSLFVVYLGTIMIPFVVVITPLYQLMILIGWVDRLAALIIPWIFTAYGTFLMRQFFITIPKEIEEAAVLDGASRLEILWRIFLPASTPALATLATFTFLYAWNSFFWPLVVINTGNEANRVLTLAVSVLGGRAADAPNLVLAGAAIAILPPVIIYIFGQRFFVESSTSSGVKG
ncbi:MAG: carbohydrate ABC transporter permease [Chloroflexi bacterium]|nr:carbohydrate ABC transporter permease [Chloroflexota bacterium]